MGRLVLPAPPSLVLELAALPTAPPSPSAALITTLVSFLEIELGVDLSLLTRPQKVESLPVATLSTSWPDRLAEIRARREQCISLSFLDFSIDHFLTP